MENVFIYDDSKEYSCIRLYYIVFCDYCHKKYCDDNTYIIKLKNGNLICLSCSNAILHSDFNVPYPDKVRHIFILRKYDILPNLEKFINLKTLNCTDNIFSSFGSLPHSLQILECYANKNLTRLPDNLPNLEILNCYSCIKLCSIPYYKKIKYIKCIHSNVSVISHSDTLLELDCYGCKNMTILPNLPNLDILDCAYTNLTYLPEMKYLQRLDCTYVPNLKNLENIPNLKVLMCDDYKYMPYFRKLQKICVGLRCPIDYYRINENIDIVNDENVNNIPNDIHSTLILHNKIKDYRIRCKIQGILINFIIYHKGQDRDN